MRLFRVAARMADLKSMRTGAGAAAICLFTLS